jgi:hypothetical protein
MSFSIGDFISKAVDIVAPMALAAVFPPAAMMPAATNLATSLLGDGMSDAIKQLGREAGMPNFVINDALNLLKGVVDGMQKPVDSDCASHVADKFGGPIRQSIDDLICDFKDAFKKYMGEEKGGKGGGKGGAGGGAGGAGGSGGVGFRELAALLGELEGKQAKNVQNAVQKASDALGVAKSGKPEDAQKDADIGANQFKVMEESKAEAQIFQALSSAISEVMKNFGGALQTAARG